MICPGSVLFCAAGYLFLCIFNNNFLQPQPGRMEEIMPVKYVFVTGGVVSGLGKGITAASLGRLLKARGFSVTMQKFDPYINIDPGTMNPIQHGEVFVTDDGAETDLDLGHYERFIDESLNKNSNVTTGKVYWSVLQKERRGDFGGGTVQVIPHITNEIKSRFYRNDGCKDTQIAIIEVGGTVGDIESQPFLESIRQFQHDVGRENAILIHVTLIPYLGASGEMKTMMETLLDGKTITVNIDEQIVFEQLGQNENAVWSLLLAGGYLKAEHVEYKGMTREPWYTLSITNLETVSMFSNMFKGWFECSLSNYNGFVKALFQGDVEAMNYYMNKISMATFSYFDVGSTSGNDTEPERFYHGFVLGLLVEVRDLYEVRSNRESGYGRYDVILIPRNLDRDAMILEFKVKETEEKTLQETVQKALAQIEIKKYDAELKERGIPKERIRHYGFAFEGKKVLIG